MMQERAIVVKREVEATLVPSGAKVMLQPGTTVFVTQALGNAYTLHVHGNLVRVAGKDGDALGLVILSSSDVNELKLSLQEKIDHQLCTCFDPEIPVNILSLGLIYQCDIKKCAESEDFHVMITMTLTAAGCGMGPHLVAEVEEKILEIKEVAKVTVDLVFDPPWDKSKMSEEAKLQLGLL